MVEGRLSDQLRRDNIRLIDCRQDADTMRLDLDIGSEDVVRAFSKLLVSSHEPLTVVLGDAEFCPNRIVPVVALADIYRRNGGEVTFVCRQGTAAEMALTGFASSRMRPEKTIARPLGRVWCFCNGDELGMIVNACELEINRTVRLAKGVRLCYSWCLNEILDNVLTHSAPDGRAIGYVMVQYLPKGNLLKTCVFDAGIGLMASFANSKYSPTDAADAIRLAVMRNVTSGNGQGNGLYGLKRLVGQSPDGRLHIRSADAEYLYAPAKNIDNARTSWMLADLQGTTTVDFQICCDGELSFDGVFPDGMPLVDLWVENRESNNGSVCVSVTEIVDNCGSRSAGREMRTLVENLVETDGCKVVIDFGEIENCSSGFVDELLGKLIEKYGFVSFSQKISFKNIHGIVALLINHSISQRIVASYSGDEFPSNASIRIDSTEDSGNNAINSAWADSHPQSEAQGGEERNVESEGAFREARQ